MPIPISEPHFPAKRFVWSSLSPLPIVGPLIGLNQPPVHKQLYTELEKQFNDPLQMWEGTLFGGWLEYDPKSEAYELSPITSDGSNWNDLSPGDYQKLLKSLKLWASTEGVHLSNWKPI